MATTTCFANCDRTPAAQPGVSQHHSAGLNRPPIKLVVPAALRCKEPRRGSKLAAAGATVGGSAVDRSLEVKVQLSRSSGKLDLSECELRQVPDAVWEVEDLEELSLAGNQLTCLPPQLSRLTSLQRLQLSGNCLAALPESLGQLSQLQGLWLHGNLLEALPDSMSALTRLTHLSLAGNRLSTLPEGLGALGALRELALAGNALAVLPCSLATCTALTKLTLHGNRLTELPPDIGNLAQLRELAVQGNCLTQLPDSVSRLSSLVQLSAADNRLNCLPHNLTGLASLQQLWLYGNALGSPRSPAQGASHADTLQQLAVLPSLTHVWLEGNRELTAAALAPLLHALRCRPPTSPLKAVGLDEQQLAGGAGGGEGGGAAAAAVVQVGSVLGSGRGYFKLQRASTPDGWQHAPPPVLVVAFGSAPGVPNWGGLLARMRRELERGAGGEGGAAFDVLYVVDPARSWYNGGDDGWREYMERLSMYTLQYDNVLMLGDSMGATAALLAAPLATEVHAFCPQVDLSSSSIRPSQGPEWQQALAARVCAAVAECRGTVTVHVGTWRHDLDQARVLPQEATQLKVYDVDSHRLALYLDKVGKLLPLVRGALLRQLGLPAGDVRLSNVL